MERHLTDEEYFKKIDLFKRMDKNNQGKTAYLKSFLESQDKQSLNEFMLDEESSPYKTYEEKELDEIMENNYSETMNHNILNGETEKEPFTFDIIGFIKRIVTLPFRLVYEFFEAYISNITLLKGITLVFFAFTTIFCGWIAFLKMTELICFLICVYTPFYVLTPFDTAEYFSWILLGVVWVLPFIIHFFGKYLLVWIPVAVIGLVAIELLLGDDFLTQAFFKLLDGLAGKL